MKLSKSLLPVSEVRHNANKVVNELKGTLVITQNGKARAVLQDIETYEQTQEALALLKVMELGRRQVKAGKGKEMQAAFDELGRNLLHCSHEKRRPGFAQTESVENGQLTSCTSNDKTPLKNQPTA